MRLYIVEPWDEAAMGVLDDVFRLATGELWDDSMREAEVARRWGQIQCTECESS